MSDRQSQSRGRGAPTADRRNLRPVDGAAPSVAGMDPPRDDHAEECVLSAAMLSAEACAWVTSMLVPESMFSEEHQTVMEAIAYLKGEGKDVNTSSVLGRLRDLHVEHRVGGGGRETLKRLLEMTDHLPSGMLRESAVREMCVRIARFHQRRRVLDRLARATYEGYVTSIDDVSFNDKLAADIAELTSIATDREGVMLEDALHLAARRILGSRGGPAFGLLTGFTALDRLTGGFKPKEVTLLGAPRKTGKSTLARAIARNIVRAPLTFEDGTSVKQGVVFFSLEMDDEELGYVFSCTEARVDSTRIAAGEAGSVELDKLWGAMESLKSLPIKIFGRRSIRVRDIEGLVMQAESELRSKGAVMRLVVIDTLQILVGNEPRSKDRTEESYYDQVAREVGNIATRRQVPILLITQLTENDQARGSRAIEQHAQNMWILKTFADKPAPGFPEGSSATPVEAEVGVKFQRHGPSGEARCWFTPAFTSFSESMWGDQ